ncbi:expansin-A26-like [Phragmites australis]|uniref:expansin-A26-like n=1 Tax=Phragmites australis TaxID=29695 RepID=UPI002D766438|nr:expansin-A26-like [Phragmites australis]
MKDVRAVVESMVREAMESTEIRGSAQALAQQVKRAIADGGSAATATELERLVNSWTMARHLFASLLLGELALLADVAAAGGGAKPHVNHGKFTVGPWKDGHATFYGGRDGSGTTEGGACGYKDKEAEGYGMQTAAVSPALFDGGAGCGACYEVKGAEGVSTSKAGAAPVVVTATNQAPPPVNGQKGEHFDLTMPAFLQIAEEKAGIVPISYRKVACAKQGGIRYTITGNQFYNMVTVTNVGGAGDVAALLVKGNKRVKWTPMKRSWGQLWTTEVDLTGESLTFRVMTGDHRKATSWHVMPRDWQFGKTYQATKNF